VANGGVDSQPPATNAILIVDDAPSNLIAYRAALELLGREIVTATSGSEATLLLGRQQFSLLLIATSTDRRSGRPAATEGHEHRDPGARSSQSAGGDHDGRPPARAAS
jgi:CheY-like chemotaxis protein